MVAEQKPNEMKPHEDDLIKVTMHYMAAAEPFKRNYEPTSAIGQVKQDAMTEFGLAEGGTPDGGTVVYLIYHDKTPVDSMAVTVGELAGHQKVLQLKLVQRLTQG